MKGRTEWLTFQGIFSRAVALNTFCATRVENWPIQRMYELIIGAFANLTILQFLKANFSSHITPEGLKISLSFTDKLFKFMQSICVWRDAFSAPRCWEKCN